MHTPPPPVSLSKRTLFGVGLTTILIGAAVGIFAIAVVCGGIAFGLLVPALAQTRVSAQRTATAARLVLIGTALKAYAADNSDAYPEMGADLPSRLAPYLPDATSLQSPHPSAPAAWFHYVPGRTLGSPETAILLYEDPSATDGSGGRVVYRSLHHTFVSEPSFTEMIDGVTLDDGSPWTPHQPDWTPPNR